MAPDRCETESAVPIVSILIINWNTCRLLTECLDSIPVGQDLCPLEAIVVDNASVDESAERIRGGYPWVRLLANSVNTGFVAGNNQAYAASDPRARYVLLLNSDAALTPGALARMVEWMDQNPHAGACGPLTLNTDGTLQPTWSRFPTVLSEVRGIQRRRFIGWGRGYPASLSALRAEPEPLETDWLGGACLLLRRAAISGSLKGVLLDPDFQMYSEETDLCYRLKRAGWKVYFCPAAEAVHHGGQSSRQMPLETLRLLYRSKILFFQRHYGLPQAWLLRLALAGVALAKWLLLWPRKKTRAAISARQKIVLKAIWGK
jgi:N-acetylglucosaminyl-diphospho-decaprenol L-rhamnosyltransferase